MSEFERAIEAEEEPEKVWKHKMEDDDREITVHEPTQGQFAIFMATMGKGSSDGDHIGGVINFFCDLLTDNDRLYIETRLMDRDDVFSKKGVEKIQGYIEDLVEAWSGRPTKLFFASTPSPKNDGPKSTEPTPEPVSSGSPFTTS